MAAQRELFGGALVMDLPSNFIDASDLRQVPDTQEVFLDPESDMSIILEVLQRVDVEGLEQAVMFHFDSLAHDNSADSQQIHDIVLPAEPQTTSPLGTPPPIILRGEQTVRKFNSTTHDRVYIHVALYRIEAKGLDLVLSANIPTIEEDSQTEAVLRQSQLKFDLAAESLKILDFGLFA